MKYGNLNELRRAILSGEFTGVLVLDNDNATAIQVDQENDPFWVDTETVFEMHPEDMLHEALELLGITWEHV